METWIFLGVVIWIIWAVIQKRKKQNKENSNNAPNKTYYARTSSDKNSNDELFSITISEPIFNKADDYYGSSDNSRHGKGYQKSESDDAWLAKGKNSTVSGLPISHGMLYIGTRLSPQNGYTNTDNCLINPKLNVAKNGNGTSQDDMPYWPSYSEISPKHRRAYLEWLSKGANDPHIYTGYVFLYFYGLERRLFLDQSVEDAPDIIQEMERLLSVYGDNRSIQRYLGDALSCAQVILQNTPVAPEFKIPEITHWELPLTIKIYLGTKLKIDKKISNDDLLIWYLNHPDSRFRTPAKRLEKEFMALMKLKLAKKYPSGPKVRIPKRTVSLTYSACSNSFNTNLSNLIGETPDISSLKSPIKDIQQIADQSMEELDKLSRFLGRNPEMEGSLKAMALLPKTLVNDFGGADAKNLSLWFENQYQSKNGIILFAELAEKVLGAPCSKITKTIHKDIYNLLEVLGWTMFPAPQELMGVIKADFKTMLIPLNPNEPKVQVASTNYLLAILELSLGAYIAHADNSVSSDEHQQLSSRVSNLEGVTAQERERLHHFVSWLLIQKTDFSAIKRQIKAASEADKRTLTNVAISVAASDGNIDPQEVRALESLYSAIGMDKQELFSHLHSFSSQPIQHDNKAITRTQKTPDEVVSTETGFTLDMSKISATLHDTAKASSLLESIFQDEDAEPEQSIQITPEPEHDTTDIFGGLDNLHTQLLSELIEREEWPRNEYEQLVSSLNLMADGALETINEWSFQKFDEAIIDDDDPIFVNREIMSEVA